MEEQASSAAEQACRSSAPAKAWRPTPGSDRVPVMESLNFEFLRNRHPELADLHHALPELLLRSERVVLEL